MDEERRDGPDLWQLIETLTDQVRSGQADLATLLSRSDNSDARADASEARADVAEARADRAEVRADRAEILADLDSARVDKIEAAGLLDRKMIAELQADGRLSSAQTPQMEEALRSSRVVGMAMGLIMARQSLTEDQAFAVLAEASQDSNSMLREIAQVIVRGGTSDLSAR
jgi:ANTAR domain-containing protein